MVKLFQQNSLLLLQNCSSCVELPMKNTANRQSSIDRNPGTLKCIDHKTHVCTALYPLANFTMICGLDVLNGPGHRL